MSDDEDAAQPQEQPEREVNPKVLEKELRDKYRLGESELEGCSINNNILYLGHNRVLVKLEIFAFLNINLE